MAEGFIVRKGGPAGETTEDPALSNLVPTSDGVLFDVTNNDLSQANIYFEEDNEIPRANNIIIPASTTETEIALSGLQPLTTYDLYIQALQEGKLPSKVLSQQFTTLELATYELIAEVENTTQSNIDIQNLNINYDDFIKIIFEAPEPSASVGIFMTINNDTSNYNILGLLTYNTTTFVRDLENVSTYPEISRDSRTNQGTDTASTFFQAYLKHSEKGNVVLHTDSFVGYDKQANSLFKLNYISNESNNFSSVNSLQFFTAGAPLSAGFKVKIYKGN